MEALRGSVRMRSSDLGLGAKNQSKLVIAGSCRIRFKSSLKGDSLSGRDTDLEFWFGNKSTLRQTQNFQASKILGSGVAG